MCSNPPKNILRVLEQRGHIRAWRAKAFADILLPLVKPRFYLFEDYHFLAPETLEIRMQAMYFCRDFLNKLGLEATAKVFDAESGLIQKAQEDPNIADKIRNVVTDQSPDPPKATLVLYIFRSLKNMVDAQEREVGIADSTVNVLHGLPQNIRPDMADCSGLVRRYSFRQAPETNYYDCDTFFGKIRAERKKRKMDKLIKNVKKIGLIFSTKMDDEDST